MTCCLFCSVNVNVLPSLFSNAVESLDWQWASQTPRLLSHLRIPMNTTNITRGIICWDFSVTCILVFSWRRYLMKKTWRESCCLVISHWTSYVTKMRFVVLKNIPIGTIALEESLHRSSPNAQTRSFDGRSGLLCLHFGSKTSKSGRSRPTISEVIGSSIEFARSIHMSTTWHVRDDLSWSTSCSKQ